MRAGFGIRVNAWQVQLRECRGHFSDVPHLVELNIGHSIVSRAVAVGLSTAVEEMLRAMSGYPE